MRDKIMLKGWLVLQLYIEAGQLKAGWITQLWKTSIDDFTTFWNLKQNKETMEFFGETYLQSSRY